MWRVGNRERAPRWPGPELCWPTGLLAAELRPRHCQVAACRQGPRKAEREPGLHDARKHDGEVGRGCHSPGPQLLQPLLEQLGQQHPEILERIQSNQDEFVRLINEPIDPAQLQQAQQAMQAMGGGGMGDLASMMGGGGDGGDGGGTVQIHLTPEEGEALARLEALGFPRQVALEAYLACDKQEEMAANYLFENGMDDEE